MKKCEICNDKCADDFMHENICHVCYRKNQELKNRRTGPEQDSDKPCSYDDYEDDYEIELPLRMMMDKCNDWNDFCNDVGLNPWIFNEGLASKDDIRSVKLSLLKKHGIL